MRRVLESNLARAKADGDWPFRVRCMSGTIVVMTGRDQLSLAAGDLTGLLHSAFGFSSFRPNQEAVCRAAIEGQDVLLVMPTGSGKSLCYQLPGIARGGTTLVISSLIALMEDQVARLKKQGFTVDRIHSPVAHRLASGLHRLPQRQAAVPVHRAGAATRRRFPGDACKTAPVPHRD